MLNVRNLTLNVAAVIVIAAGLLSLLTVIPQALSGSGATPAPQATAAPASAAATTDISTTNTTTPTVKPLPPRAGPNPLVIRGDKGPLFPLFQTYLNDVVYTTAPLVVWSIDPATMAPTGTITNFVVSWLPATGGVNTAPLSVQPTGSACEGMVSSDSSQQPVCFTVSVTQANTLPTGQYTSTLYISNNTGVESTVSVQVFVGRSLLTLVAIVALGVILTELWLQWRRSWQYQRGWRYRRNQWIEWLGSNFDWLRPFQGEEAEQATRSVLRAVQAELRAQVKIVSDWLAQGQAGKLTMSDLAERLATIQALTDPISLAGRRYLKPEAAPTTTWTTLAKSLPVSLGSLIEKASESAEASYKTTRANLLRVYVSNDAAIAVAHQKLQRPTDVTLLAAWEAAQKMWQKWGGLKTLAAALKSPDPKVASDVANCVSELSSHLDSLSQEVTQKAKSQLNDVSKVPPGTPGLTETRNFLKAAAIDLHELMQTLLHAQHPLQFILPETQELQALQKNLDDLNVYVGELTRYTDKLRIAELRAQVKTVSDWLAQGQEGKLTMSDLAKPSVTIPWPYVATATMWEHTIESLTSSIHSVIDKASESASTNCNSTTNALAKVYAEGNPIEATYPELEKTWLHTTPPPADATLLAAWTAAQAMWKKYGELKTLAGALKSPDPKVPTDVANRVSELSLHLDALSQEVAEKAKTQLEAVNKVNPNTAGQIETQNFLKAAAIDLSALKQTILCAQCPLQFISSETLELKNLQKSLTDLNTYADKTHVCDLADDAAANQLLGSLRTALSSVDAKLVDPKTDMGVYWNELLLTYQSQEHVIGLGGQINDLLKQLDGMIGKSTKDKTRVKHAQTQLMLAYQHLLSGQWLDAEITLERARYDILQSKLRKAELTKIERIFAGLNKLLSTHQKAKGLSDWLSKQKWLIGPPELQVVQKVEQTVPKTRKSPNWLVRFAVIGGTIVILGISVQQLNSLRTQATERPPITESIRPNASGLQSFLSLQSPSFNWAEALWLTVFIICAIVLLGVLWRSTRRWRQSIKLWLTETFDVFWPKILRLVMWLGSLLLSLAIAVTIIIAAQEVLLKNNVYTWGSNLDLIVAFTWGAVAHRLLQSLQSSLSSVQSFVQGEKPAADTAKAAEGK